MQSNRCKRFLKNLDFNSRALCPLVSLAMMVSLFVTGLCAQSQTELRLGNIVPNRPGMNTSCLNQNGMLCQRNRADDQIKLLSTAENFHTVPRFPLAAMPADSWLGKDKADHFIVSAFIAGACYYLGRAEFKHAHGTAVVLSLGVSGGIGLAKEIYDGLSKRGTPSWKDLAADILGTGVGILMLSNQ